MSQKKRKVFTIEEKSHIIWRLANGESNKNIAKEYGVPHSTISSICKNKDKIKTLFENNSLKTKRSRASEHIVIEKALLTWFKHQRTNNVPISGPVLQQKANDFARLLGKDNFKCSSSWVQRFRARHNIVTEEWLSRKWPTLCEGYKPEEIFNADETGLFFNLTPDKTLTFKREEWLESKLSIQRITVLVAANMTGSHKKKLLVIGKAKIPQCFENIHSLPVTYENNTESWMTSHIFEKWLRNWDAQLKSRGSKILLLVDNCPAHPVIPNLNCIKLVFLPPNVNSAFQPIDQGVIKDLKTQYRKLQVLQMLQNVENGENSKNLDILDAILMISEAWDNVTQTTISNCFRHAGFMDADPLARTIDDDNDKVPLAQLAAQLVTESKINIEEFIAIDENVAVCAPVTEKEILEAIESSHRSTDKEDEQEEKFQPTLCEAINAVTTLQKFVAFNEEFNSDVNQGILRDLKRSLQKSFEIQFKKETDITDFIKTEVL